VVGDFGTSSLPLPCTVWTGKSNEPLEHAFNAHHALHWRQLNPSFHILGRSAGGTGCTCRQLFLTKSTSTIPAEVDRWQANRSSKRWNLFTINLRQKRICIEGESVVCCYMCADVHGAAASSFYSRLAEQQHRHTHAGQATASSNISSCWNDEIPIKHRLNSVHA